MNVLAIPEDARNDQFILGPIVRAMLAWRGLGKAKVEICRDPVMGGVVEAMRLENLVEIVKARPMIDLFVLCVDRDGDARRRDALDRLEREIRPHLRNHQRFLGEHAWQELEVWALAGIALPRSWRWAEVRSESNPKEVYFAPMVKERGWEEEDDGGRRRMADEAARNYRRVRHLSVEDVQALECRL